MNPSSDLILQLERSEIPRGNYRTSAPLVILFSSPPPRAPLLTLASMVFLAEFFPKGHSASLGDSRSQGNLTNCEGGMNSWNRQKTNPQERFWGWCEAALTPAVDQVPGAGGTQHTGLPFSVRSPPPRQQCSEPYDLLFSQRGATVSWKESEHPLIRIIGPNPQNDGDA